MATMLKKIKANVDVNSGEIQKIWYHAGKSLLLVVGRVGFTVAFVKPYVFKRLKNESIFIGSQNYLKHHRTLRDIPNCLIVSIIWSRKYKNSNKADNYWQHCANIAGKESLHIHFWNKN